MTLVDDTVLADLEHIGGAEFVAEMLAVAMGSMRDLVDALTSASDVGDIDGVATAAHRLISSAGSVGAESIRAAATTIQEQARRGELDPSSAEILGLRRHLHAFEYAVTAEDP